MKTRQATLVQPGRFEIREAEIAPGDTDLLVEMEGCGLCTWELNHFAGTIGGCPQVLGHEAWGRIVGRGAKAPAEFAVGDRVTGLACGCFADYYVMPAAEAIRLRPDLDQQCVPGEPLYCVQNVLVAANPLAGDAVAVVGCGPMGLWALQGLRRSLQSLIAVDVDDRKLALAASFGATHTVNPAREDAEARILAITAGRGVDVAVEGTGGKAGVDLAVKVLRGRNPRLVVMSSFKGPIEIDIPMLCSKAVEVIYAHPGIAKNVADGVRRTGILINNGTFRIDPLVSHRFKLDGIQGAFESMKSRPDGYMKGIVIR
jgi:threonine dehydrogenase-like Zn-dependent dehydrogenase